MNALLSIAISKQPDVAQPSYILRLKDYWCTNKRRIYDGWATSGYLDIAIESNAFKIS